MEKRSWGRVPENNLTFGSGRYSTDALFNDHQATETAVDPVTFGQEPKKQSYVTFQDFVVISSDGWNTIG